MRTACPKEQQIQNTGSQDAVCKFCLEHIFTVESGKFDCDGTKGGEDCRKIRSIKYYFKPHGN